MTQADQPSHESQKAPVQFQGGYSPRPGVLGLVTCPIDQFEQARKQFHRRPSYCRVLAYSSAQWAWQQGPGSPNDPDFRFTGMSITYLLNPEQNYKAWWILGEHGETIEVRNGVAAVGQIPGAGLVGDWKTKYGAMDTIAVIGGHLYASGHGRQVYRRAGSDWHCISSDILTKDGEGFFGIHGSDASNIYAVGFGGEIYFYDGKKWHRDESPTTTKLDRVLCVGPKNVWICGKGVVLHGHFSRWDVIKTGMNLYGLAEHKGRIYVAANKGLWVVDGDGLNAVDVGLPGSRDWSTHRLQSNGDEMYSIGEEHILVTQDGVKWSEIVYPDNT